MRPLSRLATLSLAAAWIPGAPARAQDVPTPLEERAREVAGAISAEPSWREDLFHPEMRRQLPDARLRAILESFHDDHGDVTGFALSNAESESKGTFQVFFEREVEMPMTLVIEASRPHRVTRLWFGVASPMLADLDAVAEAVGELPGTASFFACRLGDEGPEELGSHAPETSLGIGSAFKLWILAALARDVAAKERAWSDVVTLDAGHRSFPSGILHAWPLGAPVSLHTLATLMISQSDNTATDELLHAVGRERVEGMLGELGVAEPERSIPLLATNELFRLKGAAGGAGARAYAELDAEERRAYLAKEVRAIDRGAVEAAGLAVPIEVDEVEWFASTSDLARTLDWFRRRSGTPAGDAALEILSVNPGTTVPRETFEYAGFKGGSEGGVLALAWLFRARDGGDWYALTFAWNHPEEPVDLGKLLALANRASRLLVP